MRAVDSHIHWWPIEYYEFLEQRKTEPRTERDGDQWIIHNGIRTVRTRGTGYSLAPECFDLDWQLETVAKVTGPDTTVLCSPSVHSDLDGLPAPEAREAARIFNEAWGTMQRRHPGKFFALAALPFQDTDMAIEELEYATKTLDLRGVAMPGSIGGDPIDAPRLEPLYARIEQLGLPIFVHPSDGLFPETMHGDAYGNLVYMSLGRVVDSSVGVLRLILSGILDRYPTLKIVQFQAGGVLPYAAGRLDKNASAATLDRKPTEYLKAMWVDTAMPHDLTIKMALEFYGNDRVLYGSDNPCWNPRASLDTLESLELPDDVMQKVMYDNAHDVVNLTAEVPTATS